MTTHLELANITHSYGSKQVLYGCSLKLKKGEVACLLGPSGCGKTTLLRCLAGLEPITAGTISLAGEEVSNVDDCRPPERRRIGLVFQDYALFPHKNVADNVSFGLRKLTKKEKRDRAIAALVQVGMERFVDAWPHALSGGQQQRVALARALVTNPELLLMDEPFSGLDADLKRRLREETRQIIEKSGVTTVMVTHDGEEAMHLGDRLLLMTDGRIVQNAEPETCYTEPNDLFVATLFGDCEQLHGTVKNGAVSWPGLQVPTELADGSTVTVVIRHHALRLQATQHNDGAVVVGSRFLGRRRLTSVALGDGADAPIIASRHDTMQHFEAGARVLLEVDSEGVFVFPA